MAGYRVSLFFVALFALPFVAQATSFFIRPFPDFTQSTTHIVRGTLRDIQVENGMTSDGGKAIYTYATVEIKETLKGSIRAPSIRVRKAGGTKDGITLEVPSSPEFFENEETVLYLSETPDDHNFEVTDLELGKFGLKEADGDFELTGGILDYPENNVPENKRSWTLNQLRALIEKQASHPSGSSATPTSSTAQIPLSSLAATPSSDQRENEPRETAAPPTRPASEAPSPLAFILGGMIALGIFLFFKRRG